MKRSLGFFFASILGLLVWVQGCAPEPTLDPFIGQIPGRTRHKERYFRFPAFESAVGFGIARTQGGVQQGLAMTVFQPPLEDTMPARPLVILAHGGGFVSGGRGTLNGEISALAQAGFVAASIDYRLIDVPRDSVSLKQGVMDAIFDAKAAVRFFYHESKGPNNYRVDTNQIFLGGYSAGAFTALHYAYANSLEEIAEVGGQALVDYVNAQGGLSGQSGNAGASDRIHGVINLSGALFDADFVEAGEPPLFSVHGTADSVVPVGRGEADGSGLISEGS